MLDSTAQAEHCFGSPTLCHQTALDTSQISSAPSMSLLCTETAVKNPLGNITGWRLDVVVQANPATESYSVSGSGSASGMGSGQSFSGSASLSKFVSGPFLPSFSVTARFDAVSGSDTCTQVGSGTANNEIPPTTTTTPSQATSPTLESSENVPKTDSKCEKTSVFLSTANTKVGGVVKIFAPNGWAGGQFVMSDTNLGTVQKQQGNFAEILAKSKGSLSISGENWTSSDGTKNCGMSPAVLQIIGDSVGIIDGPPAIELCSDKPAGSITVIANANVYTEIKVYGGAGVEDGTTILSIPADKINSHITGDIIANATKLVLVAPYENNLELDNLTIDVLRTNCGIMEPVSLESSHVYNTATLKPEIKAVNGQVACGQIMITWKLADTSIPVDGFRIINTDTGLSKTLNNPQARFWTFNPKELAGDQNPHALYAYAVEAFTPTQVSRKTTGQIAAVWPCLANLDLSNLDIVRVRTISTFDPLHVKNYKSDTAITQAVPINEGDTVTLRTHVLNAGNQDFSRRLDLQFKLTGIVPVDEANALDWKEIVLCGEAQILCNDASIDSISYNQETNTLTLTIVPQNNSSLTPGNVWSFEITGRTKAPKNSSADIFKMQATAFLNNFTSQALKTPAIPVTRSLGTPIYKETK